MIGAGPPALRRRPIPREVEVWQSAWEQYGQGGASPMEAAHVAGEAGRQGLPGGGGSTPAPRPPANSPLNRFVEECNQQRTPVDSWVIATLMAAVFLNMCKYKHVLPPLGTLGLAHTCLMFGLSIALVLWSRLRPGSYVQWRELLAAACRGLVMTGPVFHCMAQLIGGQVGQVTGPDGTAREAAFLAGLVFVSHTPRLAILGLGLPLRAGAHLAVQLASTAFVWRENEVTCAAVLSAGAGLAAGAQPVVEPGMQVEAWFRRASVLSMWARPALPLPRALTQLQQCCCLLSLFQLALGCAVPVLVHWAIESRMYCAFRWRFVGSRGHSLARGGEEEGAPLAWETHAVCGFYRGLVALLVGMTLPVGVLLVGAGLGMMWELITLTA